MRKFILKSCLYASIIFALFALLVHITDNGLRKSDFGNLKEWREVLAGDINATVLIQGSSRAWVQYDPTIIDTVLSTNAYNMGMDGAPFDIQYVRFKSYLENNEAPKLIIQNVDLDLLDTEEEFFQKYQFLPFLENKRFKEILNEFDILSFSDNHLPPMRYMGQPKALQIGFSEHFGLKHYSSQKHKGFAAHHQDWDETKLQQRKKLGTLDWKINAEAQELFLRFVTECKQKNIVLVLVYAPIYYEITDLVFDFEASTKLYSSIAKENNITFLDYSLGDISFDKRNFYNGTHLNATGSKLFSTMLSNDLKEMNVLKN